MNFAGQAGRAGGHTAYGFTVLLPVTLCRALVPPETMPNWLEPVAENNPFTTTVDAARALFVDAPAGNDVWDAVAWSLAIIAVFSMLSVWRYRRAVGADARGGAQSARSRRSWFSVSNIFVTAAADAPSANAAA